MAAHSRRWRVANVTRRNRSRAPIGNLPRKPVEPGIKVIRVHGIVTALVISGVLWAVIGGVGYLLAKAL